MTIVISAVKFFLSLNLIQIFFVTVAYSVYLDNIPSLNYTAVPSYTLTITCTDSPKGRSTSNTLQADVLENRPPTFTNLPGISIALTSVHP